MSDPADWPAGFPIVPGGMHLKAPPAGPVKVSLMAYPGRMPREIDTALRAELDKTGWSAGTTKSGPEAIRFSATLGGASVSISIRDDGGRSILQVMQL